MKINWYKLTKEYGNIGFKPGSWNKEEGLDCLTLVCLFMQDLGVDITKFKDGSYYFKYKGLNLNSDNFLTLLKTRKEKTGALFAFIKDQAVKVKKVKKGDICILKNGVEIFIGIYCGQQCFLSAFENKGVKIVRLKSSTILGAYRWAQE